MVEHESELSKLVDQLNRSQRARSPAKKIARPDFTVALQPTPQTLFWLPVRQLLESKWRPDTRCSATAFSRRSPGFLLPLLAPVQAKSCRNIIGRFLFCTYRVGSRSGANFDHSAWFSSAAAICPSQHRNSCWSRCIDSRLREM